VLKGALYTFCSDVIGRVSAFILPYQNNPIEDRSLADATSHL
jgi:hypothetical protein